MLIHIVAVGHIKKNDLASEIEKFLKRLPEKIKITEITPEKNIKKEEEKLLKFFAHHPFYICGLDEKGKNYNSIEFAQKIDFFAEQNLRPLFVIGGANGLSEKVKKKCDLLLSLGKMTWPHMIARLLLIEQIYRAHSILMNHPYHLGH